MATPYSVVMPLPPCTWIAVSTASAAASAEAYLAMLAGDPGLQVAALRRRAQAAFATISRASSTWIWAWANGWATPWCEPIGRPHTWRLAT